MNQFTNKLDFSLTLKRFKMMATPASIRRSITIAIGVIPIFVAIVFPFRDSYIDPEATYYDVILDRQLINPEDSVALLGRIYTISFTEEGKPFNGIQTLYYRKSGIPVSSRTFENGIVISENIFDSEGNVQSSLLNTINFEEYVKESWKYYEYGVLGLEMKLLPPDFSSNYILRFFDSNGSVKNIQESYNWPDSAVSTQFDQDGNVTFKEHYVDGELVEKIK